MFNWFIYSLHTEFVWFFYSDVSICIYVCVCLYVSIWACVYVYLLKRMNIGQKYKFKRLLLNKPNNQFWKFWKDCLILMFQLVIPLFMHWQHEDHHVKLFITNTHTYTKGRYICGDRVVKWWITSGCKKRRLFTKFRDHTVFPVQVQNVRIWLHWDRLTDTNTLATASPYSLILRKPLPALIQHSFNSHQPFCSSLSRSIIVSFRDLLNFSIFLNLTNNLPLFKNLNFHSFPFYLKKFDLNSVYFLLLFCYIKKNNNKVLRFNKDFTITQLRNFTFLRRILHSFYLQSFSEEKKKNFFAYVSADH